MLGLFQGYISEVFLTQHRMIRSYKGVFRMKNTSDVNTSKSEDQ